MKRTILLLIGFIFMYPFGYLLAEQFKISLIKIKENYVAGEPIIIREMIENISAVAQIRPTYGSWYKESELGLVICSMPPPISRGPRHSSQGEPERYPSGYKWFREHDLSTLCKFVEPGNYNACFKIKINGHEYTKSVNINILEPQGEDRKAYEEFGSRLLFDSKNWQAIRDKYPTSIYAGWILLHYPTSLSVSLNPELLLEEAIKIKHQKIKRLEHCTAGIEVNDKGETIWIYPDEVSRRYVNVASKFIEVHPDFYGAGVIFTQLGTAYTILNQWQNAKDAYEKALKASWENYPEDKKEEANKIKEQVKAMINLLVERRLAK